ncbi:MAG: SRPBCC domain-containing protein [Bacteroidota bacterium]
MKANLLINFTVDKEAKKLRVIREFAAPVKNVWAAWTESDLLDQWWAPKPWKTETKSMDFRVGGTWVYAMVGPEGEKHWCKNDFTSITPLKDFSGRDAFCDEAGNITESLPQSNWANEFSETADSTIVNIEVSYDELSDLEKILEMGMQQGLTAALENLDALLESQLKTANSNV